MRGRRVRLARARRARGARGRSSGSSSRRPVEQGATQVDSPLLGTLAPRTSPPRRSRGTTVSLASLRGRVVVLSFFASWCAPCAAEAPEPRDVRLARPRDHAPATVLGVVYNDDDAAVASFAAALRAHVPGARRPAGRAIANDFARRRPAGHHRAQRRAVASPRCSRARRPPASSDAVTHPRAEDARMSARRRWLAPSLHRPSSSASRCSSARACFDAAPRGRPRRTDRGARARRAAPALRRPLGRPVQRAVLDRAARRDRRRGRAGRSDARDPRRDRRALRHPDPAGAARRRARHGAVGGARRPRARRGRRARRRPWCADGGGRERRRRRAARRDRAARRARSTTRGGARARRARRRGARRRSSAATARGSPTRAHGSPPSSPVDAVHPRPRATGPVGRAHAGRGGCSVSRRAVAVVAVAVGGRSSSPRRDPFAAPAHPAGARRPSPVKVRALLVEAELLVASATSSVRSPPTTRCSRSTPTNAEALVECGWLRYEYAGPRAHDRAQVGARVRRSSPARSALAPRIAARAPLRRHRAAASTTTTTAPRAPSDQGGLARRGTARDQRLDRGRHATC